eukprot:scaffold98315_cov64-Phaeocystis_antarctica.AAC.2
MAHPARAQCAGRVIITTHRAANPTARTCAAQRRGAGQKIPRFWRWSREAGMGARPCQSLQRATRAQLSATHRDQVHVWSRAPAMSPPKTSQLPSKPPGRSQAHAVCQSVVVAACDLGPIRRAAACAQGDSGSGIYHRRWWPDDVQHHGRVSPGERRPFRGRVCVIGRSGARLLRPGRGFSRRVDEGLGERLRT